MCKNSEVYKIKNRFDVLKFIKDLEECAYTGIYNFKLDSDDNIREVFISNSNDPDSVPVIKEESNNMSLTIVIEPVDEVIEHILRYKELYTALYKEVMMSNYTIQQATEKLEAIKAKVKQEGHNIDDLIDKTIGSLKKEIGNHNSVQVDDIIKEINSFLMDRGFPSLGEDIARYGCYEEKYCHSDCYVCPINSLGEKFDDYGIDTRMETREFMGDFVQNYLKYYEEGCSCFRYYIEQIFGEYYCNLWVENGYVLRQVKKQDDKKTVFPVEQYQINSSIDIERLTEILNKDIRLINHSRRFGCYTIEVTNGVRQKDSLDFCDSYVISNLEKEDIPF